MNLVDIFGTATEADTFTALTATILISVYLMPELCTLYVSRFGRSKPSSPDGGQIEAAQTQDIMEAHGASIIVPIKVPDDVGFLPVWLDRFEDWFDGNYELIIFCNGPSAREFEPWVGKRVAVHISEKSTSKAACLNEALAYCRFEIVGIFDADARLLGPWSFEILKHELQSADCVQGANMILEACNGSLLHKFIGFEAICSVYASSIYGQHPSSVSQFRGTNGFWRKSILEGARFNESTVLEDLDITIRRLAAGGSIRFLPRFAAGEEPPDSVLSWYRQRTRWALGWGQLCRLHLVRVVLSSKLSIARKVLIGGYLLWFALCFPAVFISIVLSSNTYAMFAAICAIRFFGAIIQAKAAQTLDIDNMELGRNNSLVRSGAFLMSFCLYQFGCDIVRLSAAAGFLWRFDNRWNPTRKRHLCDRSRLLRGKVRRA